MSDQMWRLQAACRGYEITTTDDPWHAEGNARAERDKQRFALSICAECPVKADCLRDALEYDGQYGIRGGLTAPQRTRLKIGAQSSKPLAPCGTPSAYTRHIRRGEPVDAACRLANSAAQAARRAQKQEKAS